MKIIRDNCAYVQLSDIKTLEQSYTKVNTPKAILDKASTKDGLILLNESNRINFVKYEEESEVEFFKNIDWIVDYDELKDLSDEELLCLVADAQIEQKKVSDSINKQSSDEQENSIELKNEFFTLYYKMFSLKDFIMFKRGEIDIQLPEGIEYPKGYKRTLKTNVKKLVKKITDNIGPKF